MKKMLGILMLVVLTFTLSSTAAIAATRISDGDFKEVSHTEDVKTFSDRKEIFEVIVMRLGNRERIYQVNTTTRNEYGGMNAFQIIQKTENGKNIGTDKITIRSIKEGNTTKTFKTIIKTEHGMEISVTRVNLIVEKVGQSENRTITSTVSVKGREISSKYIFIKLINGKEISRTTKTQQKN